MNPLRIVHKNSKAISDEKDGELVRWSRELLKEQYASDIRKAEKKYGKNLDHLRIKYNVS
jgi:hypothetical protein